MASFKPPMKAFQPDELELLGQMFNDIWATIKTSGADRDLAKDEELRTAVSERLCALAAGGVRVTESGFRKRDSSPPEEGQRRPKIHLRQRHPRSGCLRHGVVQSTLAEAGK